MHLDLLFHCCTGKGAKTKLHQEYPHRKKRIPPLSRKLVFFANRNTQRNMQLLDKIHTVFTAALIVMQGYFTKKKKKKTNLDLLSIPRLWGGGNKYRIHGKLGIQLSF